jgi:hypothetical protein
MESKNGKKSVTRKSRAMHRCPKNLDWLIEQVNEADARQFEKCLLNDPVFAKFRSISDSLRAMSQIAAALPDRVVGSKPRITLDLTIGEDGRIGFKDSEILEALIGVDATRIRECEICQRIFWARQDNMYSCGSRCSATRRQRKLRENRSEYDQARAKKKWKKP